MPPCAMFMFAFKTYTQVWWVAISWCMEKICPNEEMKIDHACILNGGNIRWSDRSLHDKKYLAIGQWIFYWTNQRVCKKMLENL